MSETPMVATWMGKPLDELTREEAIAALKIACRLNHDLHESIRNNWKFHETVVRRYRERPLCLFDVIFGR